MYVVQVFQGNNFYTDSLEEAKNIYFEACQSCEFVELLEGEPGHYKTIMQSW